MWCLIFLYDNEDDADEKSPDLIPNDWIINKFNCWYPLDFKISTIKKYAKTMEIPDYDKWKTYNYEYGLKLMYKLNKNSNLHSEIEESGRRQRLKVKTKRSLEPLHYSSHSDEDDILLKDKPAAYPTFPKKQKNQTFNENKKYSNNTSPLSNDGIDLCFANNLSSAIPSCSSTPLTNEPSNNLKKCKLAKKVLHSCTFIDFKDNTLLEAIGHQLCKLSADMNKVKSNINYVKQDVSSFIEDQPAPNRQLNTNINSEENHLSCFPLKTESELLAMKKTLQNEELNYTNKLVSTLIFASEGKNISKVTYSILKIMFSDELLKYYSWKGQKQKKSLSEFIICKVIIGAVRQKFPDQNDCRNEIINSIMSWLAQAPTRIANKEKQQKRKEPVDYRQQPNLDDDNIADD